MFLRLDQLNSVFNGFLSQFKTVGKKIPIKIPLFCTHFLHIVQMIKNKCLNNQSLTLALFDTAVNKNNTKNYYKKQTYKKQRSYITHISDKDPYASIYRISMF